jgi:aminocarboxymuconate-semialdehyde decarboxylase
MKVIDLDSHSNPRPQDYIVDAEYSHLRPRVYVDSRGTLREIFNNKIIRSHSRGDMGGEEAEKSNSRLSYYDGSFRYKDVVDSGVDFQFISAGSPTMFNYVDARIGTAFCRAYNDFLYNAFMKPYPKTLMGLPQLPLQSIPESIRELERCVKDLGMITFLMPTNLSGTDMADPYWWNFYDRVRDLGITGIVLHVHSLSAESKWVGKERLAALGPEGTRGRRILSHPFEYSTNIVNLIFGGMMDSFPEFRFAFLETGAEFALLLKHRIEDNLEIVGYLRNQLAHPLEWYFERFYFVVDERLLRDGGALLKDAIRELGPDHLFFGSDYPHHGRGDLDMINQLRQLDGVAEETKEKILGNNVNQLLGRRLV